MIKCTVNFNLLLRTSIQARSYSIFNIKTKSCKHHPIRYYIRKYSDASNNRTMQKATAAAAKAEPFLSGTSSVYVEEMYNSWLEDPNSVHKVPFLLLFPFININFCFLQSWQSYFKSVNAGAAPGQAHQRPPPLGEALPDFSSQSSSPAVAGASVDSLVNEHLSVQALIRGYQVVYCLSVVSIEKFLCSAN